VGRYHEIYIVVSKIPTHYFPYKGYEEMIPYFNLLSVEYCVSLPNGSKLFQESLQISPISEGVDDEYNDESYSD
jgi:hypothetical protein